MKWTQRAWEVCLPVYKKTIEHPFIKELMDGSLTKEKFEFYIQQDALYLAEYRRVLLGIAGKLDNINHSEAFTRFANDTMDVENALHESFFKLFSTQKDAEATPSCLLYTSFLHTLLGNKSVHEAVAGILPCFWIYKEVGDYILENASIDGNPYKDWINTYGGEEYAKAVEEAIDITDEIAEKCSPEQQEQMIHDFVMTARMEWLFWDAAYRLEKWKV